MAKPRLIILIRHAQSEGNSAFWLSSFRLATPCRLPGGRATDSRTDRPGREPRDPPDHARPPGQAVAPRGVPLKVQDDATCAVLAAAVYQHSSGGVADQSIGLHLVCPAETGLSASNRLLALADREMIGWWSPTRRRSHLQTTVITSLQTPAEPDPATFSSSTTQGGSGRALLDTAVELQASSRGGRESGPPSTRAQPTPPRTALQHPTDVNRPGP